MKNILKIDNLNFKIGNKILFENLSLTIKKNDFITIGIANNGGKTILANIISGNLNSNSVYFKDSKLTIADKKSISLISNNELLNDTVEKNILFTLNNLGIANANTLVDSICDLLNINYIKNININKLSMSEKTMVRFAQALAINPEILVIDDSLCSLGKKERNDIYKLLRKLNKDMTIINITSCIEYTKTICVINKKVIECGNAKNILSNEKLFASNNISIPFMAQLSNKLKYYQLCNNVILSMNAMVNKLWK